MPTLQFSSLGEFLQMGAYTFHVWIVYLLFAVFLSYNLLMPRLQRRQFLREQRRRATRDAELASQSARRRKATNSESGASTAGKNTNGSAE